MVVVKILTPAPHVVHVTNMRYGLVLIKLNVSPETPSDLPTYPAIVTTSVSSDQNCNTRDRETRETREVPVLSTLDSQDNRKEGQSKQDNIKEGQSKQYNQDNLKEGQSIKLQDNVSQYHLVPWIPSVDTKEHLFVG